jgi:Putative polyhydroxyalkanoic acid system protein (PHA_gran_rgn)
MSEPLVVSIPHRLGREEAVRRLKAGLAGARTKFAHLITISEETWQDDRLTFHASALGQAASGLIDVRDDHVVLTVQLPWLLAKFAQVASSAISKQGTLMLEKK